MAYTTLPTRVIPSHYALLFEPDFATFTFKGEAAIDLAIPTATRTIALHVKELTIHKASLQQKNRVFDARVKVDEPKQLLLLSFPQALQGKARLIISYTGIHNGSMYGFYRSKYYLQGKEHYLLSTQFEAPNARAAFPCFDEPAFKATFEVTLVVDKG